MYVRFIEGEKLAWSGRDEYPASIVFMWMMNEAAGDPKLFDKPIKVEDINYSQVRLGGLPQIAGDIHSGVPLVIDSTKPYGTFEFYDECNFVAVETDNYYYYVVANSERAQQAMMEVCNALDIRFTE